MAAGAVLEEMIAEVRGRFAHELARHDTDLYAAPAGCSVASRMESDALIGLPLDVISPQIAASLQVVDLEGTTNWIPRWPALTKEERAHETAFAQTVEEFLRDAVQAFLTLAMNAKLGCLVFEVDAAKRLYRPYDAEPHVRAIANHALHPAGVVIARLAFLMALDHLATLPSGDPRRSILITNGGCAAGKGSLVDMVRSLRGGAFTFGAVWDAAGEGEAQENVWILEAALARSLHVVFGFVENDPMLTYRAVLDRALVSGRIVDPMTFTRSYARGHENMRGFLASPAYAAVAAGGHAEALGIYAGPWDPATGTYPERQALGAGGKITAHDVRAVRSERAVFTRAIEILEAWLAVRPASDRHGDWFIGSVVNMLKFRRVTGADGGSQAS